MALFTNMATLSYNRGSTNSNMITGEIQDVLAITKTAITGDYTSNDDVTYVISIINSGTIAFTGLTVTDNLGLYDVGNVPLYPLTYVDGSIYYYVNGVLQATPAATSQPPLTISGITVPAGGNVTLIYEATVNQYAPLGVDGTIVNEATLSGGNLSTPITATETIRTQQEAVLTINKSLYPTVVSENGQITYTFTIQNSGNTAATTADNVTLFDTFDPILDPITVTFNGTTWTSPADYSYDTTTGLFETVAGQITVPAATYTQNPDNSWTISPGVSTVVVTGTV